MVKQDFDNWCTLELPKLRCELIKKYPRCKQSITQDLSDYYEHVITKQLQTLENPKGYLFSFIYNRHYRFFSTTVTERSGHLVFNKNLKIKITDEHIEYPDNEIDTAEIERQLQVQKVQEIIHVLPLYDQKLYDYYYVQGKTIRQIALDLDLSPGGIHKQIKKLQLKVKKLL